MSTSLGECFEIGEHEVETPEPEVDSHYDAEWGTKVEFEERIYSETGYVAEKKLDSWDSSSVLKEREEEALRKK